MKTNTVRMVSYWSGIVLLASASTETVHADYSAALLAQNPLAYWHFDEPAASPAPYRLANSGSLGTRADAYAIPSVTNGVQGVAGNALQFYNPTGTSHADSRAQVVYNPGLNTPQFTIEFWSKPSAQTLSGAFDATGASPISNFNPNGSGGSRVGWLFYLAPSGKWNFRLGLNSGYAVNLVATSGLATADKWQHIVATYDGTVAKLYADGVLVGTKDSDATASGWVPNTGSFLQIGATPLVGDTAPVTDDENDYIPLNQATAVSGNRGWDGLLDEIAIYTNALPAATVAAHYSAAATPGSYSTKILEDRPAGYWNFNEPAVVRPDASSFPKAANVGSIGSQVDGTNTWGAVTGQDGPRYGGFSSDNRSVTFDGLNGSFVIKDAPQLHFKGKITLAAWVKPLANNYVHNIIAHGPDGIGAETFLRISRGDNYGTGNYYEVGSADGQGGTYVYESAQAPIPSGDIGQWVFIVGTFDGANWNLYRNGSLAATLEAASGDSGAVDVTNTWTIGSRALPSPQAGFNFSGSIDEPAIFNRALSAADVAALYAAAKVPPVITIPPVNPGLTFKGSTVSFSVLADGTPSLKYLWTTNGVSTGVTATNYSIANIGIGEYKVAVTVSNDYGTNTSSVNFSSIAAPPTILIAPVSESRFEGFPFLLSVNAGGTSPLTYYWLRGDAVVQSGSVSNYGGMASAALAGIYRVVVSNETGISVTSAPVQLTVNPIPAGYGKDVLAGKPTSYWRLNEKTGSSVAYDGVGGKDGKFNNVTLGAPGFSVLESDTAVSFSGVNSYIGGISGTNINFSGAGVTFTVEAWVKASAGLDDESTIIAKGIGSSGTTRTEQFALDVAGGVYRFFTTRNGTVYAAVAETGPDGSWQHIVGVYDGQNILGDGTNIYLFVNGQKQASTAAPAGGPAPGTTQVTIGSKRLGNDPNYNGTFQGSIDEVAIYNYALDAATIEEHYDALYGTTTPPLVSVPPTSATNYVGLPVTLKVIAAGSAPISYQWYHNGSAVAGATESALVLSSLASKDAGEYTVTVSNGIGTKNAGPATVTVLNPPTSPPNIPGLVLHLPLNNNLIDVTGRGNNGTNVNNATFVADGPMGAALHYSTDSTNASDIHYVTLGVRPDLNFGSNVSFTVAFWVRLPLNYQGGDLPFFTDATNSTFNKGFVFAPTYGFFATAEQGSSSAVDGGWAFSVLDGNGDGVGGHGPVGTINDGGWHHLVYVIDRAKGAVVYLDGVPSEFIRQQGTSVINAGDISTRAPATIGQDPSGRYGEFGSGDIADLGVWRRALTKLEAASIFVAASRNKLSYIGSVIDVEIKIQTTQDHKIILTWPNGTLQSSSSANGPFQDVTGASSPTTVDPSASQKTFYRVKL